MPDGQMPRIEGRLYPLRHCEDLAPLHFWIDSEHHRYGVALLGLDGSLDQLGRLLWRGLDFLRTREVSQCEAVSSEVELKGEWTALLGGGMGLYSSRMDWPPAELDGGTVGLQANQKFDGHLWLREGSNHGLDGGPFLGGMHLD